MSTDGDGPAAERPFGEALADRRRALVIRHKALTDKRKALAERHDAQADPHGDSIAPPALSAGRSRWRIEKLRQDAIHHDSRHACVESKTLIDGAAERVLSSGKACVTHNEQVAKSRITIAQSRALMKRLDSK